MTYTIAFTLVPFAAISAMLLASGWTQTAASFPPRRDDAASPPDHDIGDAERWLPMDGGVALESLLRHVLDRLAPVAARHFATLEFAAQPGLGLAADCPALREALMRLVGDAIQASSGGRVLLAAALA